MFFVAEAPNWDDTFNEKKGYLTVDPETDPSGRFFFELFTGELGQPLDRLAITNAVLCLPERRNGKHGVPAAMIKNCSGHLRNEIDLLNPRVVAPLGLVALNALRQIEDHGLRTLRDAVGRDVAWYGRTLFALAHPSRLGRVSRSEAEQRADWRRLRAVLDQRRTRVQVQLRHPGGLVPPQLSSALEGRWHELPSELSVAELNTLAHMVNGYDLASLHLGEELLPVADRMRQTLQREGAWRGNTLELLASFFAVVRGWRWHYYDGPSDGDEGHREAQSLYAAVRLRMREHPEEVELLPARPE